MMRYPPTGYSLFSSKKLKSYGSRGPWAGYEGHRPGAG